MDVKNEPVRYRRLQLTDNECAEKEERTKKSLSAFGDRIDAFLRRLDKTFQGILKKVDEHEEFLQEICKKQDCLDETLGSVLMAIKQNEYLQAYYPEQNGFPAGKHVGLHPSKIMESKNRKK